MPRKDAYGGTISAQAQQDLVSEGIENFELPKSLVMKIAKSSIPDNVKLQKETVLSLVKSSTVFINYLELRKSLLQTLYGHIRAGRLSGAVEVCRRAHEPWRAASKRGSLLFQWKALSTERKWDDDGSDDEDETNENPEVCSGRSLWKSTCVRAALSPSLSDQERLFFASLAPTQETAASRTWEDNLWTVTCEDKASRELSRLTSGSFWEGGVDAVEKGVQDVSKIQVQQEEEA